MRGRLQGNRPIFLPAGVVASARWLPGGGCPSLIILESLGRLVRSGSRQTRLQSTVSRSGVPTCFRELIRGCSSS